MNIGAVVQSVRIHACHAWGHGFESRPHRKVLVNRKKFGAVVQSVRIHACHAWGHGFESRPHRFQNSMFAEIAQLVEHDLAKVGVASSSLVFRSPFFGSSMKVPAQVVKLVYTLL